jgi:amidase
VTDVAYRSAIDLVDALHRREVGSLELLDHHLERIDRLNPRLNAVVTLDVDRARVEARAADAAIAAGDPLGALHGLPMTIKDCIATAGMRTTAGAPEFADYVPEADAVAVSRLRSAGAIVFGKTNLPAWAGDCQSYNDIFGTTNNPWDADRTPGGSSGGAATAVAAGLTPLELGSDLGGSIRIPVHFCGVYELKPTWGIIPTQGHIPPPPGILSELDVSVVGPIARSAEDLELALGVLAGGDAARAIGWRLELPPPRAGALGDYRVAASLDDPYCPIGAEVQAVQRVVVDTLVSAGVAVDESARPPSLAEGHDVAQRLIQGSMSHALPSDEFERLREIAATRPPDDDAPATRWARNITQLARELNLVIERRARLSMAWAEFFRRYDVLLCPVMLTPAFLHDHSPDVDARTIDVDGTPRPYSDQFAWLQAIGVAQLPVVTAPIGRTPSGLPVGIQVVAPYLEDRTAIDFARRMAEVVGGYVAPPGF